MNIERVWVVSTYNQDPSDVIADLVGDWVIYNQGDPARVPATLKADKSFRQMQHTGHNLSDYLAFILENYDDLPAEVGLAKGNLFPRHISRDKFLDRQAEGGFQPLYGDTATFAPNFHKLFFWRLVSQQVMPGLYLEQNNNWYLKTRKRGKHYQTFDDLHRKIFDRSSPRYILFTPGACMLVPSAHILRWPKELYAHLYDIVSYTFFPVEAFHVERMMFALLGATPR